MLTVMPATGFVGSPIPAMTSDQATGESDPRKGGSAVESLTGDFWLVNIPLKHAITLKTWKLLPLFKKQTNTGY